MPQVFLSHSSQDMPLARRVGIDLLMSGVDVWLDEWEIKVGHSISQKIQHGLESADFVVVILTRSSVDSGWVEKEWQSRIGEEASNRNVVILPALAEECKIPLLLRDKHYADLGKNYEGEIRKLIDSIRTHFYTDKSVGAGARIESGRIYYNRVVPPMPDLLEMVSAITGGYFERQGDCLRAHFQLLASRRSIQELTERLGLDHLFLDSPDFTISNDPAHPTVFEGKRPFVLPANEFSRVLINQKAPLFRADIKGVTTTVARGIVDGGKVKGTFSQIMYSDTWGIRVEIEGEFEAIIAICR